ncbi:MAG: aspartyl/glutamyl-tRNA amidotransferase subunit A [Burkholderiaceae bacterium]|nr:aspartyl/glutamyl-tRNA amidotransferase subunit A [Burkholderiaceae bacterium]
MNWQHQTLRNLSNSLINKEISSLELCEFFLERMTRHQHLNAYLDVLPDQTREQARRADHLRSQGLAGPLTGIPIAHKDVFVTKEWVTTAASKMLAGYKSPFNATVVAALGIPDDDQPQAAGMVCLGKTNMDDCALLLSAMSIHDPRDSTSLADSGEDYGRYLNQPWSEGDVKKPLAGLRIGLPKEFFAEGLAHDVAQAVLAAKEQLQALGAFITEVSLPKTQLSIPVYYVLAPAEASSNLSRYDGVRYGHRASNYSDLMEMYQRSRSEGFGAEVKRRILIGSYVLSHGYYDAYYLQAQKIRRIIAADFAQAFTQCDVILGPVAPDVAWGLGDKTKDPLQMYLEDIYTLSANLAGLPAMSAPCGFSGDGLPIGMQLIGNYFSEARLLQVAHQYQQVSDWHLRRPEGMA